ncbi:MAG: hypothetical protein IPN80_10165 [Flavobacterium sp.]|nr:hypothetical protein [Flavobacterium sp.]
MYELSETNVSSHNCRHTFTNLLLDMENVNVNYLRILLGHSSLVTTQKYIQTGFRNKKQNLFRPLLENNSRKINSIKSFCYYLKDHFV